MFYNLVIAFGLDDKYKDLKNIFKTAHEVDPLKHIKIMEAINDCIDESISKTINLQNKVKPKEIFDYIIESHKRGLNGITFFRDKCLEERNLKEKNMEER